MEAGKNRRIKRDGTTGRVQSNKKQRECTFPEEGRSKASVKKGLKNDPLNLNTSRLLLNREITSVVAERKQETDLILINGDSK